MESLFSLPLPFQRRLTKMYTDTKNSYDFVKEPVKAAEDPEMIALHRKLRIQKDRLVSWGLEWSDPTQSPDIDESINRAGLAELVGSVMSTIKEILAEAEPLWQASKGPTYEKLPSPSEKAIDRKGALIVWDKSRFQDLVRDLTMSIDTLYDLSRTRQSARKPTPKASESSDSIAPKSTATEERLFESTRMQTPQQIDPTTVIWPSQLKLTPAKLPRQIVFMRRPIAPSDSKKFMGQSFPTVPVLLEHAPYDPIYSITGITPSMTRFERLFAALSQNYLASGKTLPGLLHLIGYFEEPEHSRFCLLYALPTHFGPVDIESPRMPSITILSDLLSSSNFEPRLEVRYRLAYNVASSVFDMHSKGVVHGNVMSSNILFFEHEPQNSLDLGQVDMRQSFLASCDLFSDNATDSSDPGSTIPASHRHPLDPRTTRYTRLTLDSKSLDLYSLAMLLLEIGLWTALSDIFPTASAIPEKPVEVLKQLAIRCGSLYAKAVQACWFAPEDELSQKARPDVMHQKVFFKVSKALDTCCAIDDLENTSSEETDDSPPLTDTSVKTSRSGTSQRFMATEKTTPASVGAPVFSRTWSEKSSFGKSTSLTEKSRSGPGVVRVTTPQPKVEKVKAKLRTYPSIAIAQEHLNFWHTGLMPHINYVLRGFYKKYPESVEISLESIGESPSTTKPTILVICTSVTKVRSILKRSLVYDKATFGLKVCRGKVVRSRKHGISASKAEARRSMANPASEDSEHGPENPGHQECPSNGASIGACIEGKHLPPVSFGGLIMVDDKPYGMTVHHMLDDTSDTSDDEDEVFQRSILRSSAHGSVPDLTHSDSSVYSLSGDEEYMYALSDYDSSPETDFSDDDEDNYPDSAFEEEDNEPEPGDIPGIPQGCGEHYRVTQPALDDVPEGFYPDEETRDEDHLVSYELGEVYASSGIRRRTENNVVHEVDWALFEFNSERRPEANHIENGQRYLKRRTKQYPLSVASSKNLGGVDVHCIARTSGLQTGRILPAMCIVKIFGRTTPSTSYQVAGKGNLGVPGDSGAWLVDNEQGDVAGHVLAWSSKKKVAYICPMDVLLRDIGETLQASRINLPGGEDIWTSTSVYGSVSSQLVELPASQKLDINPEITADEISQLLREWKLPPTPEQTDEFSTAPSTRHNSTKKDRGEEDKSFTPPVRLIPTPSTAQKPPLPPPRREAALGLLRTPNLHGKEDWKETGTLGRETGVVVKELEDQDSDGETDLRSTRSVGTSRL